MEVILIICVPNRSKTFIPHKLMFTYTMQSFGIITKHVPCKQVRYTLWN